MSFAEPNDGYKPVFKPPPGLPTGMSPLPKSLPVDFPTTSNPIPPGRGVKSPFRKSVPKPIPGSPPRNIPRPDVKPIPTTGPVGRSPVPNYGKIGRQIAWEILKPTPTSDGSPRDFDEPVTDPEDQPETENQTDLSLDNCLDKFAYGGKFNNPRGIYQIKTIELVQRLGGEADSRSYAINLGFAIRGSHIPLVPIGLTPREFVRLVGKKTYDTGENQRPYVIYKHSVQLKGLNPRTGKYWEGKKGIFVSRPVYKDSDPGPRFRNESSEYGYWEKLPSQLFTFVSTYLDYCPENPDDEIEPDSESDYDRTKDEKMACKWQPANDPYVASLELERIEYQKFRECGMNMGIRQARYDTAYIEVPKLLVEAMKQVLENQEKGFGAICDRVDPILIVPDWMPLKWANVEKLVVLYAEQVEGKYKSAKYQITIPHWGKTRNETESHGFIQYTKGQYQLIHELKDSSRITVNASTVIECNELVLNAIQGLNLDYQNNITVNPVLRGGRVLNQIELYPVEARFFKSGTDEIKPEWTVKLV